MSSMRCAPGTYQLEATPHGVATPTASHAVITPEAIQRLMAAAAQAAQHRDVEGLLRFFAPHAFIEIVVVLLSDSVTLHFNRDEYRQYLLRGFAEASAYHFQRTHMEMQISPDGQSALVYAKMTEETMTHGQFIRSKSTATTCFELQNGEPLITLVKARAQVE